ncbi:hypothetical protein Gpo141_00015002 [Globisporangium polare]
MRSSGVDFSALNEMDNIVENASLLFVFFFRFYYLSLSMGFRKMLQTHKLEIAMYALLTTHEYPWMALDYATGVSWEYPQAVYMRLLIVLCLSITIRDKIRSKRSKSGSTESTGAELNSSVVSHSNKRWSQVRNKDVTVSSTNRATSVHVVAPMIPESSTRYLHGPKLTT